VQLTLLSIVVVVVMSTSNAQPSSQVFPTSEVFHASNQLLFITLLSHPLPSPDIFSRARICFCFLTNLDIVNIERLDVLICWSDGLSVCWRYVSGLGFGGIGEGRLY
jgi:hypothetical protein